MQGATDKSPLVALNIVNGGIALTPSLLVGFSGSAVAMTGKILGNNAQMQINNYFAAVTWFPAEHGFFVRGGCGPSSILINNGTTSNTTGGVRLLVGGGYPPPNPRHHQNTLPPPPSRKHTPEPPPQHHPPHVHDASHGHRY